MTRRANPLDWPAWRSAAWTASAFIGLVVVFRLVLPRGVPLGVLAFGVVIGCINALVSVGLVLVYRANRIINFAQAEIGIFGAILFENLVRGPGVPWFVALLVGVAASCALAASVEFALVRRFHTAPRLILTVVTIGIAQLVVALTYFVAGRFGSIAASGGLETPLSGFRVKITEVVFRGDALLVIAIVPVVVGTLNLFLRRTDVGVAIRAAAESGERASLLGVPVRRLSTVMWAVAGSTAALATILRAPVVGLVSGSTLQGPGLLLRALAAAVIGRMVDLRTAVVAAIFIGVVEQGLVFSYGGSTVADVVFVAIIIVALLVQRQQGARSEDANSSSWTALEEVRRIPAELRRLPEVRWGRWVLGALCAGAALSYPLVATPSKENLASAMVIYALVGVSLVVLTGWSGQISLGQFGLVGLGAGVAARLSADAGLDFLVAMLAGGAAGSLAALVLGAAALRIRGFFFAVTSLGFAVAVQNYFLNRQFFSGLTPRNRPERPILFGQFNLDGEAAFYYFCLAVLVATIFVVHTLRDSRVGRGLRAVRDNEKAAQAFGVRRVQAKLLAFAVSGFLAGIAGALFAVHQHAVSPTAFSANESVRVFSMVVIGGIGSVPGAVLGAVYVRGASFLLVPQAAVLATGVGLLAVLLIAPGGLGKIVFGGRDLLLRGIARRRGLVVPSLLRDGGASVQDASLDAVREPVTRAVT